MCSVECIICIVEKMSIRELESFKEMIDGIYKGKVNEKESILRGIFG